MGATRGCLVLVLLFLGSALQPQTAAQRLLVNVDAPQTHSCRQQAEQHGLKVLGSAKGLLVLSASKPAAEAGSRAGSEHIKATIAKVSSWPGVQHVEEDRPRYLQRSRSSRSSSSRGRTLLDSATAQQGFGMECSARDKAVSTSSMMPEFIPYGISQIQADSSKLPSAIDKSGVLVCIIDSGVDAGHPDLQGNTLDGCKYEDSFAPAGCPFKWSEDFVSHGTHVAGTIAAKRDGQGLVGVIPNGAELYVVRVFNDTGDVNQGQGLVYGGTLILAFTQCEGRLAAMQARFPERQYRMVVSMSLGAPGPLTIEQLFFREAAKRGDILFVGSSGNNGTSPTLKDGKLTSSLNPGNFPGTYPEVISVAAVDCNNRLAPFSQKHASVDISAPGVDILSTASRQSPSKAGMVRAAFKLDSAGSSASGGGGARFMTNAGIGGTNSQIRWSGVGQVSGAVVDCGDGSKPCPEAKGNICMVQWDPKMKTVERSNARMPSSAASTTNNNNMRGRLLKWFSSVAGAAQNPAAGSGGGSGGGASGIPAPAGGAASGGQQSMPTRFTCDLMEFCLQQGAKGALLAAPAPSSGYYPEWGWTKTASGEPEFAEWPFFANLKCTAYNCSCWERLKGQSILPAAGLTLKQYTELKAAVAANKGIKGSIESQPDSYQRLSGTSMAVPHVSGALARIWADFPNCRSDTVRRAIEETARDLGPPGKDTMFGHGLLQAQSAYDWLARQPCARDGFTDERGQKQSYQESRAGAKPAAAAAADGPQGVVHMGARRMPDRPGRAVKPSVSEGGSSGSGPAQPAPRNLVQQQRQQQQQRGVRQ